MTTGLEALGAASAVLQVLSFAGSLVSLCFNIYDGKPIPHHDLENYASRMADAAELVHSRSQVIPQGTTEEKKLAEIAQKCMNVAKDLQAESQLVTKRYQKGNLFAAVSTAVRVRKHKKKIEDMQHSLERCEAVMETQLLVKICDKGTATEQLQSQRFQDLEGDVKNLILQTTRGYTKLEDLVSRDAKKTRDGITSHVTSEFRASGIRAISDSQRERLLKSLKVHEMNQRYHDVMDSEDASFERVFASYERVCHNSPEHKAWRKIKKALRINFDTRSDWQMSEEDVDEIDQVWGRFTSWLQSKGGIFWIQGKPGSGKSTLMKFIIESDNTKRLLDSWSPGTKILSHFFWKIGSSPQNSIKGLLSCLLHGLLYDDSGAINQIFGQFPFYLSKDSYHDWSVRELENVLFSLLRTQPYSKCIFIDGLDEISKKDGFSNLISLIEKLKSCDKLKLCVSSRPETQFVNRLRVIGAKYLQLENLTRPEMAVHIHKELTQFTEEGQLSACLLDEFTVTLLDKAEGVFLWLFLAIKSLVDGIENHDDEQTLLRRLEELPGELEDLYTDMWARLNANSPVYRETAARYFRYAIADPPEIHVWEENRSDVVFGFRDLTLGNLALADHIESQEFFPLQINNKSLADLESFCETTAKDISHRCAGMLRTRDDEFFHSSSQIDSLDGPENPPWATLRFTDTVVFIHRTAHDFLVDTEAGQRILNYKYDASMGIDTRVRLFKSLIYLAAVFYKEFSFKTTARLVIEAGAKLIDQGTNQEAVYKLLPVIQDLYEDGVLGDRFLIPGCSRPRFLFVLACVSPHFNDFIMSSLKQADSTSLATDLLRDITTVDWTQPWTMLIQQLIKLGANPHAIGKPSFYSAWGVASVFQQVASFELFLRCAINHLSENRPVNQLGHVDVIDTMAQICPNWHRKTMVAFQQGKATDGEILMLSGWDRRDQPFRADSNPWAACEVNLQFLLTQFLAAADLRQIPIHSSKLREIAGSFTEPYVRIRHIALRHSITQDILCYRVIDQQPFHGLLNSILRPKDSNDMTLDDFCAFANALDHSSSLDSSPISEAGRLSRSYEKVAYRDEMAALVQEVVGFRKLSDLGIYPPGINDPNKDVQPN